MRWRSRRYEEEEVLAGRWLLSRLVRPFHLFIVCCRFLRFLSTPNEFNHYNCNPHYKQHCNHNHSCCSGWQQCIWGTQYITHLLNLFHCKLSLILALQLLYFLHTFWFCHFHLLFFLDDFKQLVFLIWSSAHMLTAWLQTLFGGRIEVMCVCVY